MRNTNIGFEQPRGKNDNVPQYLTFGKLIKTVYCLKQYLNEKNLSIQHSSTSTQPPI